MHRFSSFLSFLLILAFVTAGISPACNWVSGGTMTMEICTADGSVKTIEVSAADYGFEEPKEQMTHMKDDCAFCFSFDHQAYGLTGSDIKLVNSLVSDPVTLEQVFTFPQTIAFQYARGPPAFFS